MKIHDISPPVHAATPVWPGDTPYDFDLVAKIAEDPLLGILGDLIATEYLMESQEFAGLVQGKLAENRSRGVKQAPFVVLMGVQMPAALVEIGVAVGRRAWAPTLEDGEEIADVDHPVAVDVARDVEADVVERERRREDEERVADPCAADRADAVDRHVTARGIRESGPDDLGFGMLRHRPDRVAGADPALRSLGDGGRQRDDDPVHVFGIAAEPDRGGAVPAHLCHLPRHTIHRRGYDSALSPGAQKA